MYCTFFFFFNDTATTEIYTLSLHDALPILCGGARGAARRSRRAGDRGAQDRCADERRNRGGGLGPSRLRSEEHTSELQSRQYLVCRLLLEKKKREHDWIYHYRRKHVRPTAG